jgi:hypothetical protein
MRPSTRGRIVVDERVRVLLAPKDPQPLDWVSPMQHRFEDMALLIHIRHPTLSYSSENPIRRRPRLQANNREPRHRRLLQATNERYASIRAMILR